MNERDEIRLRHMLDESRRVQRFIHDRSREDMDADDLFAYAVVRAARCALVVAESQLELSGQSAGKAVAWSATRSSESACL